MAWKQKLTAGMADVLRFLIRGALLVDAILIACGSIYFITKFMYFSLRFLDRTLFSSPW